MRRRNIIIVIVVLAALAAVAALLLLRRGRPPQAARLLPTADAYFYIDLSPLRTAGLFKNAPANLDPDYAQFVSDTGFQFERDLDQAAFAVHLPPAAAAADSRTPPETRYSEVFVGRFDGAKLAAYLRRTAESSRPYGNTLIYSIPLPGRTLRVAVLSKSMVASSNAESAFAIQEIIDRHAETFTGSGPEPAPPLLPPRPGRQPGLGGGTHRVRRTAGQRQIRPARRLRPVFPARHRHRRRRALFRLGRRSAPTPLLTPRKRRSAFPTSSTPFSPSPAPPNSALRPAPSTPTSRLFSTASASASFPTAPS